MTNSMGCPTKTNGVLLGGTPKPRTTSGGVLGVLGVTPILRFNYLYEFFRTMYDLLFKIYSSTYYFSYDTLDTLDTLNNTKGFRCHPGRTYLSLGRTPFKRITVNRWL